jgi:hypothetical protein
MKIDFKKSDKVRFVRKPDNPTFNSHFELTKEFLDLGKQYTVEHVFLGDPSQLELQGVPTMLFISEMFDRID